MSNKYNHKQIENKWQEVWGKTELYKTDLGSDKKKHYNLVMFPYPSADFLHIGHGYSYSGADVYARFKRLSGFNVFEPIGYDAFGLPAENFAIKKGIHPREVIQGSIGHSDEQLRSWGCMFDWSKQVNTSDPSYYKWTQWLFLKLYEQGLAYQKEAPVNWCPSCKTVLANEQVLEGECERCGSKVEIKNLKQWFFKITDYAERLIKDLDKVDWPESSVVKQRNWIGRSEGTLIKFEIRNSKSERNTKSQSSNSEPETNFIEVFTTRVDTIFGCTYLVVAPENPIVREITTEENKEKVEEYIKKTQQLSEIDRQLEDREKTGVFTGSYAINPFNGKEVPIWVADYVLAGYGTGAVMAVPAHDERDFEFAKKFGLPIKQSIAPSLVDESNPPQKGKKDTYRHMALAIVYDPKANKYLVLKWKKQSWTTFITGGVEEGEDRLEAITREIAEETGYTDVQLIKSLGIYEAFFFAAHKDVNRRVLGEHFLFELKSNKRREVAKEEQDIHEVAWLSPEEIEKTKIQHVEFEMDWEKIKNGRDCFTGNGVLIDSDEFSGLTSEEAREKMADWLEKEKKGLRKVNFRLRDWSIGRQRYWGAPIPVIYCHNCLGEKRKKEKGKSEEEFNISIRDGKECAIIPVPEQDLPVLLPEVKDFRPKGTGKGPLASNPDFVKTKCPNCQGEAERETDTMDTFVCSSFYFLRYPSADDQNEMMNKNITQKWLPVDMYVGGAEHVTMHLLYARFITKALYDAKLISFDEPFSKLRHQGMILGPDGKKMSKSKGNVIIPDTVVKEHGADAFRLNILFMGPFEDGGPWNERGMKGIQRFLEKIWHIYEVSKATEGFDSKNTDVAVWLNRAIKKVGEDIEGMKFNTAISALMTLVNNISGSSQAIAREDYENLLILLSPFGPHITEEIWHELGNKESIFNAKWPSFDENLIEDEVVTVAVQINGKVRGQIAIAKDAKEEDVLIEAQKLENITKYLEGKEIKKTFYVKGKLLSIVI